MERDLFEKSQKLLYQPQKFDRPAKISVIILFDKLLLR